VSEPVEVAYVRISRVVSEDEDAVAVEASDDLGVMEGLGMLEMAKDTWLRTNGLRDYPDA